MKTQAKHNAWDFSISDLTDNRPPPRESEVRVVRTKIFSRTRDQDDFNYESRSGYKGPGCVRVQGAIRFKNGAYTKYVSILDRIATP